MAQLDDFIYYIRKRITPSTSSYYYVDSAGVVWLTGTKTAIDYAPSGWQDKTIRWARDWEKSGIFTSYTVPMKFVMDGAKILRYVFYTDGIDLPLELYIEKLDRSTMTYSSYFLGDIDLTTIEIINDYVTATIKGIEYIEQLKTRSKSNYEIAVDTSPDFFYIRMDGIDLVCTFTFYTITEPTNAVGTGIQKPVNYNGAYPGYEFSLTEPLLEGYNNGDIFGKAVQVNFSRIQYFIPPNYPTIPKEIDLQHAQDWFLYNKSTVNSYDITVTLDFTLHWGVDIGEPDARVNAMLITASGIPNLPAGITNEVDIFTSAYQSAGASTFESVTGSQTVTVAPGEALWLVLNYETLSLVSGTGFFTMTSGGEITVNYNNHIPESYIKAIRPNKVFDELVDQMSGGDVTTDSTILDTYEAYAVTCGDALRGLPNAVLKTNFNDFFKAFDNILLLGTDFDESTLTHYIRERDYYFDGATVIDDLGDAANLDIKFLTAELFAGIDAGYKSYDYDEVNGTDEFNASFEWLSPTTKTEKKLDIRNPYRADMFGIEFTRANLVGKTTTDSSSDNDTFLINIEAASAGTHLGVDYYEIYRDGTLTVTGLLSPGTAFNIGLSPKRNLLNYGAYIRSMLYLSSADSITFQIAEKNQLMETTDGVTIIEEDGDILISDLDAPLFYPVIFEFDFMPSLGMAAIINSNPYGCFTFNINGEQYKGFLIDVQENPATNESKKVKLLSTTTNTLTDLI